MNQQTAFRMAILAGAVSCGCRSLLAGDPTFDITSLVADSAVLVDGGSAGDRVGESAALSEGYLVVGAPGVDVGGVVDAGRVYVYDAAGTTLLYTLESPTPGADEEFGESVATDGELIVVGARNDDEAGFDAGAVFVYEAKSGALIAKILPESPEAEVRFGSTVAMNSSLIFVCALNDSTAAMYGGAVEVLSRADLSHLTTLYPSQPEVSASFGSSLAATDNTLAIGSGRSDLGGLNSGAVHVFDLMTLQERFATIGSGTGPGDGFASSLALSDERLFVGSPMDQGAGTDAGAVYVFDPMTGEELS